MTTQLIRVAIIAAALLLTALLVPDIVIDWADDAEGILLTLLGLAVVFGFINAFIRPLARLVSLPLNLATLGLFSVVLNAGLLLLLAFLVDLAAGPLLTIGGFPPELGVEAVASAAVGALFISAISTGLTMVIPDA